MLMPESYYNSAPTVLGDFNNDNQLDIAYILEARYVYIYYDYYDDIPR